MIASRPAIIGHPRFSYSPWLDWGLAATISALFQEQWILDLPPSPEDIPQHKHLFFRHVKQRSHTLACCLQSGKLMENKITKTLRTLLFTTLLACLLVAAPHRAFALPPGGAQKNHAARLHSSNPLNKLPRHHRQFAAVVLIKKHYDNKYGTDGELLHAAHHKGGGQPHGFDHGKLNKLMSGLSTKQKQVVALHTLALESKSDTLTAAAVNKLSEQGDKSSFAALYNAMTKGGNKTIPATVNAVKQIGHRDRGLGGGRKVLDLSKHRDDRSRVESVLKRGAIQSIKKLDTDNSHAFATYLVTFKNKVHGQPVKAVFKPTGPGHAKNWLRFTQNLNGRGGAYSFMSREVFAYKFDRMLGMNLVPPTTGTIVDVPGTGKVMGSLQYFMPGSKAIGSSWRTTRGEFKKFEGSQQGVRQMDTIRTMAWIMSSVEHTPTSLMGGNKGNILVAHKDAVKFPVGVSTPGTGKRLMLIDNASSYTHKKYLSDDVLPLRFEGKLINRLKGLDKGKFMRLAVPALGQHEANWAWGRIQHTLNMAKTRPQWN